MPAAASPVVFSLVVITRPAKVAESSPVSIVVIVLMSLQDTLRQLVERQGVDAVDVDVKSIEGRHAKPTCVVSASYVAARVLGMAARATRRRGNGANRFSRKNSLSALDPCPVMTTRSRLMAQRIIQVEAKSPDAGTSAGRRQARLPLAERGPAVGARRMYQTQSARADRQRFAYRAVVHSSYKVLSVHQASKVRYGSGGFYAGVKAGPTQVERWRQSSDYCGGDRRGLIRERRQAPAMVKAQSRLSKSRN